MGFTGRAEHVLETYVWPGNIRQLYNTLVHASIHCGNNTIDVADLPGEIVEKSSYKKDSMSFTESSLSEYMDACESEFIRHVLQDKQGNITAAARVLNISRMTLYGKLSKHGIVPLREGGDETGKDVPGL